ncbi:MAG TPA: WD40 repeat domain-containing protein [Terriglobales bacterium]|nr:WD40 repeat domain-containing protein [Terriglobales bacterium]
MRIRFCSFLAVLSLFVPALIFADGTRTWEQSKFEELIKGTSEAVAISSTGGLELAPAFKLLSTTPSTYLWSIAADQRGILYAAAGSPARVYRITPDGKSSVIFEPQELQVQALLVEKSGTIFAATNPDGKIYKLEHHEGAAEKTAAEKTSADASWSASVFFDPSSKYIWDLAFDREQNLYVATGDPGQILRITPEGKQSVFFNSDEANIRVLAFDRKGDLIAGSDGSGLIYRITPRGDAFVLYSAPKKEITALAIDREGTIYAAGAGEKHAGGAPGSVAVPVSIPPSAPNPVPQTSGSAATSSVTAVLSITPGAAGGSEIYRIAPDRSPARIWSSHEDLVYALAFDHQGRLLAGTGNRGHIFAISSADQFSDLLKATANQATAFSSAPGGGLYVSTSNLGKVFLLSAEPAEEGTYQSDVFDAHIFSRWGRAEYRGVGNVELFARSGNVDNPDRNWSVWKKIDLQKDSLVNAPAARFVQWKAVLHSGAQAPQVESVSLNYLPENVAPEFDEVTVQVGLRYQPLPKVTTTDATQQHFDVAPPSTRDRDSVGVRWMVHDDNDDQMVYSVYYRGDGQNRWLLLKDNLTDKFYSFDASLLPDGGYTIKVVASDAPSHSPGQALTAERESARFEVDTTPPQIEKLAASAEGAQLHVSFRAVDSFSPIKRAEYSVDAGDWQYVEPVGQISDSKTENYDFEAAIPADSGPTVKPAEKTNSANQIEHVVVVRVYDRYDNMSSAKVIIRGK